MSDRTRIAWAGATWNPIVGCSPAGAGCVNCYAKRMAQRLAHMGKWLYRGIVFKGRWNGKIAIAHAVTWNLPLRWRKPRKIFVCSMGDLFHPEVPREAIQSVSDMAADCPQHTFLWLTKRGERMAEYARDDPPPPNVWCGISASTGQEVSAAMETLRDVRASVRWISMEPLLNNAGFDRLWHHVDWVVVGCESGPNRRPCDLEWVRLAVKTCRRAHVPLFVKQLSINGRVSHDPSEWPEWARVREWPTGCVVCK